jgi:hypothetical protein
MAGEGGVRLGVLRAGARSAAAIAAHSRAALDRPLRHAAELWVAVASDDARVLGAYQRGAGMTDELPLVRRGSGGPDVLVGPGTVHVALALSAPDALEPCDEKRIVNRAVRPLLRALTKTARLAHYFGRDWVSVMHRPAAWVGFAHDGTTGRALFEAFVALRVPFAATDRTSFLGKPQGTLEEIAGRSLDAPAVADAIADAYVARHGGAVEIAVQAPEGDATPDDPRADPPWAATIQEAIGVVGAGPDAHGKMRVGGDLLVSRDALARLEARLADASDDDVGRIVDETLAAPGVAIEGVRSLASVQDVVLRARR